MIANGILGISRMNTDSEFFLRNIVSRVRFLSLARSKRSQWSAIHRPGYWNNLSCDWSSTAWAYSERARDRKRTLGWGLLRRFPPFRYFPNFSTSPKYMLAIEYHVHIWQVSPQLRCGDTCQIWMRFKEWNRYFCQIEYFAYGEIDARNFSNPHPWSALTCMTRASRPTTMMRLWNTSVHTTALKPPCDKNAYQLQANVCEERAL